MVVMVATDQATDQVTAVSEDMVVWEATAAGKD